MTPRPSRRRCSRMWSCRPPTRSCWCCLSASPSQISSGCCRPSDATWSLACGPRPSEGRRRPSSRRENPGSSPAHQPSTGPMIDQDRDVVADLLRRARRLLAAPGPPDPPPGRAAAPADRAPPGADARRRPLSRGLASGDLERPVWRRGAPPRPPARFGGHASRRARSTSCTALRSTPLLQAAQRPSGPAICRREASADAGDGPDAASCARAARRSLRSHPRPRAGRHRSTSGNSWLRRCQLAASAYIENIRADTRTAAPGAH